jgi:hypothetical protein
LKNGTAPPVICRPKGKSVPCVGQFDLRAQAEVASARRSDTPKQVRERTTSPCSCPQSHSPNRRPPTPDDDDGPLAGGLEPLDL